MRRFIGRIGLGAAVMCAAPAFADGDLAVCNRTSYVFDLALGLETRDAAATRGWFRIEPGQCRTVMQGTMEVDAIFVHVRPDPVYPDAPLATAGHIELCIAPDDFVIAGARRCPSARQQLASFTEVKPSASADGLMVQIAEEADYEPEQARLAGIQRLLVLAGYDAEPIDGIEGRKTENALAQFLRDRKRAEPPAQIADLIELLLAAARPTGAGFSWCNDTSHVVMAAIGVEEKGAIVTRGWFRVLAGRCLRPQIPGKHRRLYTFGEAVDAEGRTIRRGERALAWGGDVVLCAREHRFEIAEHGNCGERGLAATGFVAVDLGTRGEATVRFGE